MTRSKHTEAQMIGAVQQMEANRKAEDVAQGWGERTHDRRPGSRSNGGMDVSEAQESKRLRMRTPDCASWLQICAWTRKRCRRGQKKRVELPRRRAAMKASVEHIREKHAFTERRAYRLLLVSVSSYRYKPR